MSIKIPYLRKKVSTLLILSAIVLLLLAASPLLLSFNPILQPVQAQTTLTFGTSTPSTGAYGQNPVTLTFQGQATISPNHSTLENLGGIFELGGGLSNKGPMTSGGFTNDSGKLNLFLSLISKEQRSLEQYELRTSCGNSVVSVLAILGAGSITFQGPVECSSSPSQTTGTATTAQDSDGDGIPDSSDRCDHNSNHRCFKEGQDTSNSATQQQPTSSSSNGTGNQTKG